MHEMLRNSSGKNDFYIDCIEVIVGQVVKIIAAKVSISKKSVCGAIAASS